MKFKFLNEFKAFALRGNVVDMAVGIIIGTAFGKIVSSVVSDLLMPPLGLLIGGIDFKDMSLTLKSAAVDASGAATPAVIIHYGNFLQIVFDFTIVAFCIFLLVKVITRLQRKEPEKPAETPEDIQLLREIRDALKDRAAGK